MTHPTAVDWWPHPDGPYPLIDNVEDGGIEERCWVPVRVIDGVEYATERATGGRLAAAMVFLRKHLDYSLDAITEDGMRLILVDGTTWQRPRAQPDGYGCYVEVTDDPCDDHDGDACESCKGTGKLHITHEGCPWESCKPTAEGAVEFYVLEVADAEPGAAA